MFLSSSVLSRLIKNQYKTVLKVGSVNDGLLILGNEWTVWLEQDHIPNKIKATIVELAGGLPPRGNIFSLSKDFPEPKFEEITEGLKDAIDLFWNGAKRAENLLKVSPIMLDTYNNVRLLQTQDGDNIIVEVNQNLLDLIDISEIDLNIEGHPTGPCYDRYPYGPIYWYNSLSILMVLPKGRRVNSLFSLLSEVTFDDNLLRNQE